jgi:hypothetical protein
MKVREMPGLANWKLIWGDITIEVSTPQGNPATVVR